MDKQQKILSLMDTLSKTLTPGVVSLLGSVRTTQLLKLADYVLDPIAQELADLIAANKKLVVAASETDVKNFNTIVDMGNDLYGMNKHSDEDLDKLFALVDSVEDTLATCSNGVLYELNDHIDWLLKLLDQHTGSTKAGDKFYHAIGMVPKNMEPTEQDKEMAKTIKDVIATIRKDYSDIYDLEPVQLSKTATGYSGSYTYTACHTGNIEVIKGDGFTISGGGSSHSGGWKHGTWHMVIGPDSVADGPNVPVTLRVAKFFPVFLGIPFPDMETPQIPDEFWTLALQDIRDIPDAKVLCTCVGGHGRTGTMLSIFEGLVHPGYATVDEIVQHIRDVYCQKAVESDSQMAYIGKVLGLEWTKQVQPHKSYAAPASKTIEKPGTAVVYQQAQYPYGGFYGSAAD